MSSISFGFKDHFRQHKKYYFIFLGLMLIGLITGILTVFKFSGEIELEHLNDGVLVDFLEGDTGAFMLLIRRIFSFSLLFFILYIINIKRFTCFLNFILILYQAYILGLNCAVLISLFNLSGIINVFIVYLTCHLLLLISLMGLATIFCSSCFNYKRFGENIFCSSFWQQNGRAIVCLLVLAFFAILLETILLPTFCNVFVVI